MLTPIQAAKFIAGIANKGYSPQPHVLKDPRKEKLIRIEGISESTYNIVRKGLETCIDSGTGQASKFTEFKVAGKTGSAEVKGYAHTTHGWFASYAPADDPEIVVAVFAEGAGHGGSVAAPVAKKIYEAWYAEKTGKPNPELENEEPKSE
jgi:penicillin-binding protein 2